MAVENNTYCGGQYLSTADGKRDEVLLKLFDHAVDKKLAEPRYYWHDDEIDRKFNVLPHKNKECPGIEGDDGDK